MSLAANVEVICKRKLTPEEVASFAHFQQFYDIPDSDPMIVVLAMLATSQLAVEKAPDILQQKVSETIELHRTVLREQSVLIAKELITTVAQLIEEANVDWKVRWLRYAGCFIGGAVIGVATLRFLGH